MSAQVLMKYWLLPIIWIAVIFAASSDLMSAEQTSRFIGPFLRWFVPDITDATIASVQFFVRKCAHLTEYAILALLLYRAVLHGTNLKWSRPILFASACALSVLIAMCDEFRQSFVESRDASPWDVMIDSAGAISGLMIYSSWTRRRALGHRKSRS